MVYVHVPFCRSFCTYCGFYSEVCRDASAAGTYIKDLCSEAANRAEEIRATRATDTLYIGGGTPSVLPLSALRDIVDAVRTAGGYADGEPFAEFTIEVNPEDIVEKGAAYASGLRSLGADRISMGIQSFDDGLLRWMNRRHTAARAVEAMDILRTAGFGNISIDLIFGISRRHSGESEGSGSRHPDEVWEQTLDRAISLAPEHISAYQLSVEDGSALAAQVEAGRYAEASDDFCRHQYDLLCRRLAGAGYRHYEISNFARPGFEARHNSAYWRRVPYVGLGPGAHSFSVCRAERCGNEGPAAGDGTDPGGMKVREIRRWNSETPTGWTASEERLTPEDARVETLMLGLRTDLGLPAERLFALAAPGTAERLLAEGALTECSMPDLSADAPGGERSLGVEDMRAVRRIRIPEDHFFVSDEIIRELI